ncbi:diphthamide biosynthesis enzyme Dph2 [archaeon]|nr:diphthamide biosynthesis enzyme Dph2 [archaeon]
MLNTDKIITEIMPRLDKRKPKKVLLQAPEGLKTRIQKISDAIEKKGIECIIHADPTYGACDIPDFAAKMLGCDLIVHIGHTKMINNSIVPVEYIEVFSNADILTLLKKHIDKLKKFKTIALTTTVQHVKKLEIIKEFLESKGHTVLIGKSKNLPYKGQVLGCDPTAAIVKNADAILYIGSGTFHPLGITKATKTPIYVFDIETEELVNLKKEQELYEKKCILKVIKYNDAKNIGLLVSTKKGQFNENTSKIVKIIKKEGKNAWILNMEHISPDKIEGMTLEVIVNTACPRIEDDLVYHLPIVNWSTILRINKEVL